MARAMAMGCGAESNLAINSFLRAARSPTLAARARRRPYLIAINYRCDLVAFQIG